MWANAVEYSLQRYQFAKREISQLTHAVIIIIVTVVTTWNSKINKQVERERLGFSWKDSGVVSSFLLVNLFVFLTKDEMNIVRLFKQTYASVVMIMMMWLLFKITTKKIFQRFVMMKKNKEGNYNGRGDCLLKKKRFLPCTLVQLQFAHNQFTKNFRNATAINNINNIWLGWLMMN